MRCRPRNLALRRRWPLRLGLFLIYVLVQYVASTGISSEATTLSPSSTLYDEDSTTEPTGFSTVRSTEEIATSSSTDLPDLEGSKKKSQEGKSEESSKGHVAKTSSEGHTQDLSNKGATRNDGAKNNQNNTIAVSTNPYCFEMRYTVGNLPHVSCAMQVDCNEKTGLKIRTDPVVPFVRINIKM